MALTSPWTTMIPLPVRDSDKKSFLRPARGALQELHGQAIPTRSCLKKSGTLRFQTSSQAVFAFIHASQQAEGLRNRWFLRVSAVNQMGVCCLSTNRRDPAEKGRSLLTFLRDLLRTLHIVSWKARPVSDSFTSRRVSVCELLAGAFLHSCDECRF